MFKKTIQMIKESPYAKNAAKLATGTAIAQCISILMTPVVTRLYDPSVYGVAASFIAMAGIIGFSAALRYEMAVVLPDNDEDGWILFRLSLCLAVIFSFAASAGTWAFAGLAHITSLMDYGFLFLLLPFCALVTLLTNLFNYWANRKRAFSLMAENRIWFSVLSPSIAILLYFAGGANSVYLIIAMILAGGVALSILYYKFGKQGFIPQRISLKKESFLAVAKRYYQFPKFNFPMTLLDQVTSTLPLLAFNAYFSSSAAAFYALANNVLRLPSSIVGQAVGQVFYEEAARSAHDLDRLRRLVKRNIKILSLIAILVFLPVFIAGPWLFKTVFGMKWEQAGEYARLIAILSICNLVGSPISTLPSVLNRQNLHFYVSSVVFATRILSVWYGVSTDSPKLAVFLYSASEAVMGIGFLYGLYYYVRYLARKQQAQAAGV